MLQAVEFFPYVPSPKSAEVVWVVSNLMPTGYFCRTGLSGFPSLERYLAKDSADQVLMLPGYSPTGYFEESDILLPDYSAHRIIRFVRDRAIFG